MHKDKFTIPLRDSIEEEEDYTEGETHRPERRSSEINLGLLIYKLGQVEKETKLLKRDVEELSKDVGALREELKVKNGQLSLLITIASGIGAVVAFVITFFKPFGK